MKRQLSWLLASITLAAPSLSSASVTLLDKDEWKVQMSGFIETDMFHDSKRFANEVVGNTAVPKAGTFNGTYGRTEASVRNSRLAFALLSPDFGNWKTKGYFEFDLLGYDPEANTNTSTGKPVNSEGSFLTNPTFRLRHAYYSLENDGWRILAGQTWTLFGWEPIYVPTTVSVPPGPGTIYQRTPQLTGFKDIKFGDSQSLLVGLSLTRPSQRDSEMPNLDAGLKYTIASWTAGFASYTGDVSTQPFSVALSGTMREFQTAKSGTLSDGLTKTTGTAWAADAMIPVLPSADGKETGNTITLTGEFSNGTGDADAFPSWTGGLSQYPTGSNAQANTNLDVGQGVIDSSNVFHLMKIQTWNAQLQYHLPASIRSFITLGHAELWASNLHLFASGTGNYDRSKMDFINFFHDFTPQIRAGLEYAKFTTHYVDRSNPNDERWQVSTYFRF